MMNDCSSLENSPSHLEREREQYDLISDIHSNIKNFRFTVNQQPSQSCFRKLQHFYQHFSAVEILHLVEHKNSYKQNCLNYIKVLMGQLNYLKE